MTLPGSIPREQFDAISSLASLDIGNHYYDGRAYLTRFLQKQTLTHHLLSTSIVTHNFQQQSNQCNAQHLLEEPPQLQFYKIKILKHYSEYVPIQERMPLVFKVVKYSKSSMSSKLSKSPKTSKSSMQCQPSSIHSHVLKFLKVS